MKRLKLLLVFGLFLLLMGNALSQSTNTGTDENLDANTADTEIEGSMCATDEDCITDYEAAESCSAGECYCSLDIQSCFIKSAEGGTTASTADSVISTATGTPPEPLDSTTTSETAVAIVEEKLKQLQEQSASVEDKLKNLEQVVQLLQQQITLQGEKLGLVSSQQSQSKELIQKDVTTVATGLAGLQKDVGTAKENLETVEEDVAKIQAFKLIVTIVGLILISAGILLGLQYYLKTKKVDSRLLQYVLKQLRAGRRYPQLHQVLSRAGWGDEDIKAAFREAGKRTAPSGIVATTAQGERIAPVGMDPKKVMLLAGFALFFIIGIILVLKGVTTGKAIYFKDTGELSSAVKESIEKNLEKNEFYGLAKQLDLCVQVEEGENVASYRITKTKKGDIIKEAALHCDNTNKFGFAVKFKSWEAFDLASNSLSCTNIKTLHTKKQLYVLPSKFVEAGFEADPTMDFSPYCAILSKCLTAKQMQDAGIEC